MTDDGNRPTCKLSGSYLSDASNRNLGNFVSIALRPTQGPISETVESKEWGPDKTYYMAGRWNIALDILDKSTPAPTSFILPRVNSVLLLLPPFQLDSLAPLLSLTSFLHVYHTGGSKEECADHRMFRA